MLCVWASSNENGKASGGKLGDQTTNEVKEGNYYSFGQDVIYRFNDKNMAKKFAAKMREAAANQNIGYDQSNRTTLYKEAKKLNYDIQAIKTPCACDCSSLVACCLIAVGLDVSATMTTSSLKQWLVKTGQFTAIPTTYDQSKKSLQLGDIINKAGKHVIVCVEGEDNTEVVPAAKVAYAKKRDAALSGTYKTTAPLHIRVNAGTNYASLGVLKQGTKVRCYGYYSEVSGVKWYLVASENGISGFCSSKYLSKE